MCLGAFECWCEYLTILFSLRHISVALARYLRWYVAVAVGPPLPVVATEKVASYQARCQDSGIPPGGLSSSYRRTWTRCSR